MSDSNHKPQSIEHDAPEGHPESSNFVNQISMFPPHIQQQLAALYEANANFPTNSIPFANQSLYTQPTGLPFGQQGVEHGFQSQTAMASAMGFGFPYFNPIQFPSSQQYGMAQPTPALVQHPQYSPYFGFPNHQAYYLPITQQQQQPQQQQQQPNTVQDQRISTVLSDSPPAIDPDYIREVRRQAFERVYTKIRRKSAARTIQRVYRRYKRAKVSSIVDPYHYTANTTSSERTSTADISEPLNLNVDVDSIPLKPPNRRHNDRSAYDAASSSDDGTTNRIRNNSRNSQRSNASPIERLERTSQRPVDHHMNAPQQMESINEYPQSPSVDEFGSPSVRSLPHTPNIKSDPPTPSYSVLSPEYSKQHSSEYNQSRSNNATPIVDILSGLNDRRSSMASPPILNVNSRTVASPTEITRALSPPIPTIQRRLERNEARIGDEYRQSRDVRTPPFAEEVSDITSNQQYDEVPVQPGLRHKESKIDTDEAQRVSSSADNSKRRLRKAPLPPRGSDVPSELSNEPHTPHTERMRDMQSEVAVSPSVQLANNSPDHRSHRIPEFTAASPLERYASENQNPYFPDMIIDRPEQRSVDTIARNRMTDRERAVFIVHQRLCGWARFWKLQRKVHSKYFKTLLFEAKDILRVLNSEDSDDDSSWVRTLKTNLQSLRNSMWNYLYVNQRPVRDAVLPILEYNIWKRQASMPKKEQPRRQIPTPSGNRGSNDTSTPVVQSSAKQSKSDTTNHSRPASKEDRETNVETNTSDNSDLDRNLEAADEPNESEYGDGDSVASEESTARTTSSGTTEHGREPDIDDISSSTTKRKFLKRKSKRIEPIKKLSWSYVPSVVGATLSKSINDSDEKRPTDRQSSKVPQQKEPSDREQRSPQPQQPSPTPPPTVKKLDLSKIKSRVDSGLSARSRRSNSAATNSSRARLQGNTTPRTSGGEKSSAAAKMATPGRASARSSSQTPKKLTDLFTDHGVTSHKQQRQEHSIAQRSVSAEPSEPSSEHHSLNRPLSVPQTAEPKVEETGAGKISLPLDAALHNDRYEFLVLKQAEKTRTAHPSIVMIGSDPIQLPSRIPRISATQFPQRHLLAQHLRSLV